MTERKPKITNVNSLAFLKAMENEEYELIPEDLMDFAKKWQIRPGNWGFDAERGLIEITQKAEVYYDTPTSVELKARFQRFWNSKETMEKYQRMKRSYLLYSEPGVGKSALIRDFCRSIEGKDSVCILKCTGDINFSHLKWMFRMPYRCDVKAIILVIEDMGIQDYLSQHWTPDSHCLNFLDGDSDLFRVPTMLLVTTNHPNNLGPALLNRPGRFSEIIQVQRPSDDEIFSLVERMGQRELTEHEKAVLRGKQMTPDHCIEVLIRAEIDGLTLEESVNRVIMEREGVKRFR